MKKATKPMLLCTAFITVASVCFAQKPKQSFSQNAPPVGSFVGKTIRSCFGSRSTANAKVIAVVNSADWCIICQKNSRRVEALLPLYKEKPIAFIPNDLTDDPSKTISAKYLKKLHIYTTVQSVNETGTLILIDAKTHLLISKISLENSDKEIEKAINQSLNTKG